MTKITDVHTGYPNLVTKMIEDDYDDDAANGAWTFCRCVEWGAPVAGLRGSLVLFAISQIDTKKKFGKESDYKFLEMESNLACDRIF